MISKPFFSGASSAYSRLDLGDVERRLDAAAYSSSSYSAAMANSRSRRHSAMRLTISSWPPSDSRAAISALRQRLHGVAAIRRLLALQLGLDGIELVCDSTPSRGQLVDEAEDRPAPRRRSARGTRPRPAAAPRARARRSSFSSRVELLGGGDALRRSSTRASCGCSRTRSPTRAAPSTCSARASRRSSAPAAASSRRRG